MKPGDRVRLDLSMHPDSSSVVRPVKDVEGQILILKERKYMRHVREYAWHVEGLVYWLFEGWLIPLTKEEVNQIAPKNNDGRDSCWWCPGVPTGKRGGGAYDLCLECGR